jgi:hypothetical protein
MQRRRAAWQTLPTTLLGRHDELTAADERSWVSNNNYADLFDPPAWRARSGCRRRR